MEIRATTQNSKFIGLMLALGCALSLANTGCSTPDVPYSNPNPPEVAWDAYQSCVQALPPTANLSACNYVGTSSAQTANDYTGLNEYVNSNGQIVTGYHQSSFSSTSPGPKVSVKTQLAASYKTYLTQVDSASLKEMTRQWNKLAAGAVHGN